jgi:hypothetical protein
MSIEEDDTLVECRACGGHWKTASRDGGSPSICRWCVEGLMTAKQIAHWLAHKSGPRRLKLDGD